jgi:hypothetical protein
LKINKTILKHSISGGKKRAKITTLIHAASSFTVQEEKRKARGFAAALD